MSLSTRLEDFHVVDSASPMRSKASTKSDTEDELQSFEAGFQAGWDDAVRAQEESNLRVSSALIETISDIAFQSADIQQQHLIRIAEVVEKAFSVLLPNLSIESLNSNIVAQITNEISENMRGNVIVSVSQKDLPTLDSILPRDQGISVELKPSSLLSDGQAKIAFHSSEIQIDIESLNAKVIEAVRGFAAETTESTNNAKLA